MPVPAKQLAALNLPTYTWGGASNPPNSSPTAAAASSVASARNAQQVWTDVQGRSEEHTSELQSQSNLVCRLLLEKKKIRRSATAFTFSPKCTISSQVHELSVGARRRSSPEFDESQTSFCVCTLTTGIVLISTVPS